MRVLLVEDNDDLRCLFARLMRLYGCEVYKAADGRSALDAVLEVTPDLVVTDLMMPEMDGVELIGRLRAIPELASVPAVVITADATGEAERRARRAGAVDFLIKPVDVGVILESYPRYLETARGRA
jgi:two-component system cell cycle response regulator DivK